MERQAKDAAVSDEVNAWRRVCQALEDARVVTHDDVLGRVSPKPTKGATLLFEIRQWGEKFAAIADARRPHEKVEEEHEEDRPGILEAKDADKEDRGNDDKRTPRTRRGGS